MKAIKDKRKVKKMLRKHRTTILKRLLNKHIRKMRNLMREYNNNKVETFITGLGTTKDEGYYPWRKIKNIKRPKKTTAPWKTAQELMMEAHAQQAEMAKGYLQQIYDTNRTQKHRIPKV